MLYFVEELFNNKILQYKYFLCTHMFIIQKTYVFTILGAFLYTE